MRPREWIRPVVYLASNWISLIGVVLVTTGGVLWLLLLPSMLRGSATNAYLGILQFLILPIVFFTGLALIPVGIWWQRRHTALPAAFPPVDLENPHFRRLVTFVGVTTVLNLIIGGQLVYRAVNYMDTTTFCGQTCHTVMKPEFTAYQNSPHSRVECVSCHIGPGADWFVKSKISGAWQVVAVTFNLYDRPIPVPVKNLRPARETCEVCHWPQKFGGNRIRVIDHFSDDERAKRTETVLMMRIGGGEGFAGIHGAHMGPGVVIRYAHSDEQRQKIPWVEYTRDGVPRIFKADKAPADAPAGLPQRTMDCMDCHTRPSHAFELPERAVDRALARGELDASLPYVRKQAVAILKVAYRTSAEAERAIPDSFIAFYREKYPQLYAASKARVDESAREVLALYSRNVFPEMHIQWGTYPNNIGHTDFEGCFRCHDERKSADGKYSIPQDCSTCHSVLAMDEENPKVLSELGLVREVAQSK